MDALLERLEDILIEETELYRKLVELSKQKTEVLMAGDTEKLDRITREEQGLIFHGGILERNLEQCILDIAGNESRYSGCNTLSQLIENVSDPHKQKLSSIGRELSSLLHEQKELNELNTGLIQSNLDYINHLLSRMQGRNSIYSLKGTKVKKDTAVSLMDKKI